MTTSSEAPQDKTYRLFDGKGQGLLPFEFLREEESSSSLMPLETRQEAPPPDFGESKVYILLVKDTHMATPELNEFDSLRQGMQFLHQWLERKNSGQFVGRIWAFYGQLIDYSTPISKYQVTLGDKHIEISSTEEVEFVGKLGGPDT